MGEKNETNGPSGMPTLRWTFKTLAVLGYFPRFYWPTLWQKILYKFYRVFLTICLYILETTQLLDLLFGVESQDEFSENLYITLVFFCDCCKTVALLRRSENIVDLVETVKKEPFAAMNAEEEKIQAKFMEQVEWVEARNDRDWILWKELTIVHFQMELDSLHTDTRSLCTWDVDRFLSYRFSTRQAEVSCVDPIRLFIPMDIRCYLRSSSRRHDVRNELDHRLRFFVQRAAG